MKISLNIYTYNTYQKRNKVYASAVWGKYIVLICKQPTIDEDREFLRKSAGKTSPSKF